MNFLFSRKEVSNLILLVLFFSCFSYPITSSILLFFNFKIHLINIGLKLLYSIIYLILLIIGFLKSQNKIVLIGIPLILFFVLYSIRLLIDTNIRGIEFVGGDSFYVYSYYFGATMLPSLALIFSFKFCDLEKLKKMIFYSLVVINLLLLAYIFYTTIIAGDINQFFSTRINITDEDVFDEATSINPIMISYYGGALISYIFSSLAIKEKLPIKSNIFIFIFTLCAISNLLLGASKGPFIFCILLVLLSSFLYIRINSFFAILKLLITALIVVVLFLFFFDIKEFALFKRFDIFFNEASSKKYAADETRNLLLNSSINGFLESPIYGSQFVEQKFKTYPHNILLETFLSMGIIGGSLFIFICFNLILNLQKAIFIKSYQTLIPLYFIGILSILIGFTSGSIFANPEIWIFISLLTILPVHPAFKI